MSRLSAAFRSFFSILFRNSLAEDIAVRFGFEKPKPPPPPVKLPTASDGALQMLGILQRDARLIDFLMEDIAGYADDQVGAAVRTMHADCKASLARHFTLAPVIDGVEGTYQRLDAAKAPDPNRTKLLGNVPASGKAPGGTLRHRGWIASSVDLPPIGKQDPSILAPSEIEIE
ncbi:MAG: DUF2760 domain-containing protein [Bryobacteraceae bacterium]